ncbi:hypothetical protein VTJ04DRAFT_6419 [Mycothermus thermophilus]|uniref:uncharacterized protein n=1 Tax=Humicola insolens TaxID=85995 RepID=UPI003743F76B
MIRQFPPSPSNQDNQQENQGRNGENRKNASVTTSPKSMKYRHPKHPSVCACYKAQSILLFNPHCCGRDGSQISPPRQISSHVITPFPPLADL